jgi:hypothetical protein
MADGKVCRSRRCPEYGPVWAGDQRQKLFRNNPTYNTLLKLCECLQVSLGELTSRADDLHDNRLGR